MLLSPRTPARADEPARIPADCRPRAIRLKGPTRLMTPEMHPDSDDRTVLTSSTASFARSADHLDAGAPQATALIVDPDGYIVADAAVWSHGRPPSFFHRDSNSSNQTVATPARSRAGQRAGFGIEPRPRLPSLPGFVERGSPALAFPDSDPARPWTARPGSSEGPLGLPKVPCTARCASVPSRRSSRSLDRRWYPSRPTRPWIPEAAEKTALVDISQQIIRSRHGERNKRQKVAEGIRFTRTKQHRTEPSTSRFRDSARPDRVVLTFTAPIHHTEHSPQAYGPTAAAQHDPSPMFLPRKTTAKARRPSERHRSSVFKKQQRNRKRRRAASRGPSPRRFVRQSDRLGGRPRG